MKIAYADPPYIGQAKKHYGAEEVDHKELIKQLEGYDAWALSCSSPSLRILLPLCPDRARVGAWVKPFCSFKPNVEPAYAWEPIIYIPTGRKSRARETTRDWVSVSITLKKGLAGVKPVEFSFWLFRLLGITPEDEFFDLFPGSGAVTQHWLSWREIAPITDKFLLNRTFI